LFVSEDLVGSVGLCHFGGVIVVTVNDRDNNIDSGGNPLDVATTDFKKDVDWRRRHKLIKKFKMRELRETHG